MTEIRLSGGSDDLIEYSIITAEGTVEEEEGWLGKGPWQVMLRDEASGGELIATAEYSDGGVWWLGVRQTDDEHPIPDWPISIRQHPETPYSAELVMVCPDGTEFTPLQGDNDDD